MPHFDKHFTLEEAGAMLPRIRELFAEIHGLIEEAQGQQSLLHAHESGINRLVNGKHNEALARRDAILKAINERVTEITDAGVVIQDVSRGLIDFPAFINGDEVFLCYELADGDSIQYYHPLEAGYAGRKPQP